MEKHTFRNALRSKRLIKSAFLQLLAEKDISRIRINELAQLADISKGTFYAHFQDIYAVLEDIENENIERFVGFFNDDPYYSLIDDCRPFISKVFNHIEDNKEFYELLFKSNAAYSFLAKLQKVFVDYMMKDKTMLSRLRDIDEAQMFFSFIAVGTASLIHDRYTKESSLSKDKIIESLNVCILHGMDAIKTGSTIKE